MNVPLYIHSYRARVDARAELALALNTATAAIELVSIQERRITDLLHELRRARDLLVTVRAMSGEAIQRYARAGDHYRAVHVRAVPQMATGAELDQAAE